MNGAASVFCILYCIASGFLYFVFHIFIIFSLIFSKSVLYEWRGKCRGGGGFFVVVFLPAIFLADFHNFLPFNFLIQKVFSMSGAASVGEAGRRLWPVVEFPQGRVEPADISSFLMCHFVFILILLFLFYIFWPQCGVEPADVSSFLCAFFTFLTRVPMIFPLFVFVFMCLFYIVLTTVPMILTNKLSSFSFSTTFLLFFSDSLYYIFYHSADDISQYLFFFFSDNVRFNVL